jgi:hypothetical protein
MYHFGPAVCKEPLWRVQGAKVRLLLDHFSKIKDTRQAWKAAYPLCARFCFLVVCGTIANCDDYDRLNVTPAAVAASFHVMSAKRQSRSSALPGTYGALIRGSIRHFLSGYVVR